MDKKRIQIIIKQSLNQLMKDHRDLYYTPTIEIANILHEEYKKGNYLELNKEDKEEIQKLSVDDIHIYLSYK